MVNIDKDVMRKKNDVSGGVLKVCAYKEVKWRRM